MKKTLGKKRSTSKSTITAYDATACHNACGAKINCYGDETAYFRFDDLYTQTYLHYEPIVNAVSG